MMPSTRQAHAVVCESGPAAHGSDEAAYNGIPDRSGGNGVSEVFDGPNEVVCQ
jgi:hypothetical protein